MTLDTLRTPPIRTHGLAPVRHDPALTCISAVIALAVADYRDAVRSKMVSHFKPLRSHPIWTQPHRPTTHGDSCHFAAAYTNRGAVRDLLAFFAPDGGLDQWCELACLPLSSAAVRDQLNAEEDGRRETPRDSVYLTIVSKNPINRIAA